MAIVTACIAGRTAPIRECPATIGPLPDATMNVGQPEATSRPCIARRADAPSGREAVMAVDSFNTRTGAVVSAGSDYGWSVNGNDTTFALTGKVGIGTASPARALHVASGIARLETISNILNVVLE